MPTGGSGWRNSTGSVLWNMREGDLVLTPMRGSVYIGEVAG